ncbi:MAG TPA: MFS transporter [Methyloradius sp.]
MPIALYALTAGAFGIGVTEFVIMGLLLNVSNDLGVSISMAGLLISGYALGVVIGAPVLTIFTRKWPRKGVLLGLMVIFTIGNAACALAPNYGLLMAARVLTALAHGTFFGVGAVMAASLVPADKRASAIALMFTGLTVANILGVPFGTWLGQQYGWRSTFWAVTIIGLLAFIVIALLVPKSKEIAAVSDWRADLNAMIKRPVLLALLTTVVTWASIFALFTYIAPILTNITGFAQASISPILLVFGLGLFLGNIWGGRMADKSLTLTILAILLLLSAVLGLMSFALHYKLAAIVFVGLFGVVGFATAPPLQIWVLKRTQGAGQTLASSLNIAAFNLGNAIGAWLGGLTIDYGPGLSSVPLVAMLIALIATAVAIWTIRYDSPPKLAVLAK